MFFGSPGLKRCALGVLAVLFSVPVSHAGESASAATNAPGAELLWDYHEPNGTAKAAKLYPLSGATLPDGGLVLLALWNERVGPYRAYRFDANGKPLWQFLMLDDVVYDIEAWPGIVPLLRPSDQGVVPYGYVTSTRLLGPRYFTDDGKDRPQPMWRGPPPGPITALASNSDGRATIGGTESDAAQRSPLAPCSRALVVQLDDQAREVWRWQFRAEHKSTFVRWLQYLPDGSTLAMIDDNAHFGGTMERHCDGHGRQKWVVWLDSAGNDYQTILLTDGAEWVAALSDGRVASLRTETDPDASWELYWRFYATDGSQMLSQKAADLDLAKSSSSSMSFESSPRPDAPIIRGLWTGKGRFYVAVRWSGFSKDRVYESRLAVYAEDGRLLALSPGLQWRSLILGPTIDETKFIVATPDGLYRLPMPK